MNPSFQSTPVLSGDLTQERNKVLRNTYLLLAITLIPTVFGAFLGIQMGAWRLFLGNGWMGFLLAFALMYGLMYAVERTKTSALGIPILLGFTFFMGLMLSGILTVALSFRNGQELIAMAAVGTSVIFFSLAGVATITKKDFGFMGNFLFIGLVLGIIALLANAYFQIPAVSLAISAVFLLIFSAYILYDVSRIVNGGETNYISATLNLYLDIYNVFTSLLRLLMAFAGNRD